MKTEPYEPTKTTRRLAYVAGAFLVGAVAWFGIESGATVWSPGPWLMIAPAWLIAQHVLGDFDAGPQLVPFLGAAVFLITAGPLLSARSKTAWPALAVSGLVVLGSTAHFTESWSYGLRFQGISYTVTLLAMNVCFAIVSVWLGVRAARSRAYWTRYAAALVPCVWVAWCAFPWLGEMP